jgi:hypothetical protein
VAFNFLQGKFNPKHPEKYVGDVSQIIYRSSFERKFMLWCDRHQDVISWASEEIVVPYFWEGDGKSHRYFVDFWIKVKRADNTIATCLIEIKPSSQTKPPKISKGRRKKTMLNEVSTYSKNLAKWKAAEAFAMKHGMQFLILTEKDLNIKD